MSVKPVGECARVVLVRYCASPMLARITINEMTTISSMSVKPPAALGRKRIAIVLARGADRGQDLNTASPL